MLDRAKRVIMSLPIDECKSYYCKFTDICSATEGEDYRVHLIAKLQDSFRHHKYKGKVMEQVTFRCINMINWINYMVDKYELEEDLKFKIEQKGIYNEN